jgi:hypothetical protein
MKLFTTSKPWKLVPRALGGNIPRFAFASFAEVRK